MKQPRNRGARIRIHRYAENDFTPDRPLLKSRDPRANISVCGLRTVLGPGLGMGSKGTVSPSLLLIDGVGQARIPVTCEQAHRGLFHATSLIYRAPVEKDAPPDALVVNFRAARQKRPVDTHHRPSRGAYRDAWL